MTVEDDTATIALLPLDSELGEAEPAQPRLRRFRPQPRAVLRHPGVLALAAYAVISLLASNGSPFDANHIATCTCGGDQDLAQTAWFLGWTPYAILHGLNPFFTTWINLPHGANLADNTSMPLLGVLAAPVTLLWGPVAGENLLRWLSFPLSAYAMFFVARRFTRFLPAAFAAGLLYGYSPYMIGQASVHLNLGFAPFPPLIFYALYEIVVVQRRRPVPAGLLLAALCTAQFYVSPEILATTGVIAIVAVAVLVVGRSPHVIVGLARAVRSNGLANAVRQPPRVPHRLLRLTGTLAIAAIVVAIAIGYPVDLMLHGAQHYVGPSQGPTEVFNADLLGPVLPTLDELFAPHRLATIGTNLVGGRADIDENGSYLGIPLIALATYLALRYWRRRSIAFSYLLALVAFALSLGPTLTIDGVLAKHGPPLPFRLIAHLPLLDDMLPVRFSLYVVLFVSIVIALGIDAFADSVRARNAQPLGVRFSSGVRGAAVVIERAVGAIFLVGAVIALVPRWPYAARAVDVPIPSGSSALASIPIGAAVLDYPYPEQFASDAMLWQAVDDMRYRIFGSYILRPGVGGTATELPGEISPLDVQAMLSTTLTPIPLPGEPYLAPTTRTIMATRITLLRGDERAPGHPAVVGTVENINLASGAFYVFAAHTLTMTGVTVAPHTIYDEPAALDAPDTRILRAERVAVYGTAIKGTITAHRVDDLRTFLAAHHVGAVVVELGRVDSDNVSLWVRDAIGAPSRILKGADLWTGISERLASASPAQLAHRSTPTSRAGHGGARTPSLA